MIEKESLNLCEYKIKNNQNNNFKSKIIDIFGDLLPWVSLIKNTRDYHRSNTKNIEIYRLISSLSWNISFCFYIYNFLKWAWFIDNDFDMTKTLWINWMCQSVSYILYFYYRSKTENISISQMFNNTIKNFNLKKKL